MNILDEERVKFIKWVENGFGKDLINLTIGSDGDFTHWNTKVAWMAYVQGFNDGARWANNEIMGGK